MCLNWEGFAYHRGDRLCRLEGLPMPHNHPSIQLPLPWVETSVRSSQNCLECFGCAGCTASADRLSAGSCRRRRRRMRIVLHCSTHTTFDAARLQVDVGARRTWPRRVTTVGSSTAEMGNKVRPGKNEEQGGRMNNISMRDRCKCNMYTQAHMYTHVRLVAANKPNRLRVVMGRMISIDKKKNKNSRGIGFLQR